MSKIKNTIEIGNHTVKLWDPEFDRRVAKAARKHGVKVLVGGLLMTTGCVGISSDNAQATAAAARQTGVAEGLRLAAPTAVPATPTTDRLATLEALVKTPQVIVVTATPEARVTARPAVAPTFAPATAPAVVPSTPTIPARQPFSCDFVVDETLSRQVVFEGFPVKAVKGLTTDNAQQVNFFKAADWNKNAALNLGFAEPGGLTNPAKIRVIDNTPYVFQTELQGWTKVFFQEGTLEWRGQDGKLRRVVLPEKQGRTFGVYLREFYDEKNNRSVAVKVDCNVSGHGQIQHVDRPNTAFVSEGQLGQESASVFWGKNWNPATGQFDIPNDNTAKDEFTVVVIDMNNNAFTVATQNGLGKPFALEKQNWK
jgi:hypothetical protein